MFGLRIIVGLVLLLAGLKQSTESWMNKLVKLYGKHRNAMSKEQEVACNVVCIHTYVFIMIQYYDMIYDITLERNEQL